MLNKILKKVRSEPVRLRLYLVIAAIATYLLVRGYVQATDLDFILTLTALILGVERSRAKVQPVQS